MEIRDNTKCTDFRPCAPGTRFGECLAATLSQVVASGFIPPHYIVHSGTTSKKGGRSKKRDVNDKDVSP
jgi:hypothetical protein